MAGGQGIVGLEVGTRDRLFVACAGIRVRRLKNWALLVLGLPAVLLFGDGSIGGPVPVMAQAAPIESRLSAGTTGFLRTVSKRFRQMRKVLANAVARWQAWLGGAMVFVVLAVVAPVVDRSLLSVWQMDGLRPFGRAFTAAVVVYVRLVLDRRTPGLGKGLLLFAVVYGASGTDIMPDRAGLVWGLSDDILLIVLASRSFMRMCPDALVDEHARRVAERRGRRERVA